jgi:hypothetical protein
MRGQRVQRDAAALRHVVEQLALVLAQLGVVAAVQRPPHPPEGALETFSLGTVQKLDEMVSSRS